MAEKQELDVEDGFRGALQDVLPIVEKLSPICQTVKELLGVIELALENKAQFRILFQLLMGKDAGKKKDGFF